MLKQEILNQLYILHSEINDFIAINSQETLNKSRDNKWSQAEEIGHLINALQQTNKGLSLPKFFLKYKFGTCNRPERTYEELTQKYLDKLSTIQIPNNPFQIRNIATFKKEKISKNYLIQQKKFEKRINQFNEKQLSTLIIPHPLLGKITIREFVYFTHFHTKHHFENIKK
ncbi:MAG: DinB family protein [Limnohabitans sp.]|nr:DinB family protein [Limnohabitans sp.]